MYIIIFMCAYRLCAYRLRAYICVCTHESAPANMCVRVCVCVYMCACVWEMHDYFVKHGSNN